MTGAEAYQVLGHREIFRGRIFTVVSDEVQMADGTSAQRDYVRNMGAVVIAAIDHDGAIVMVHQYRHPVRQVLWELPAGLLDVAGEAPLAAAKRELAEEVDLTAARWDLLAELHTSPGFATELVRVYLARDLAPVPADRRHRRTEEEAELRPSWFPLDEAVAMAQRGELTNAATVAGVYAAARGRDQGWANLRPADTPWPTGR